MKPANQPLTTMEIYAEDKKGIVGQVLFHFNRRSFDIHSLNVARTDLQELILITFEVEIPTAEVANCINRLKKIIEVVDVVAIPDGAIRLCKIAHFCLRGRTLDNELSMLLQRHGAYVSSCTADEIVVRKIGSDDDIQSFYNALEGRTLNAFCKSLLVQDTAFAHIPAAYEIG